ncbi:hypothetical protein [Hymenobacter baengnokdamensis]|uniref:hypothetical protein n=1 Tax=Hymenobacter baengnokdamensis TaxID=2615203 RepID=UPI001E64004A|nr:hypothetical protein [Hymenobacter baengnokdamensis]
MKKLICLLLTITVLGAAYAGTRAARPAYFALKIYHLKTSRQEALVDSFLQRQYLPALHAAGVATVGVFKPIGNDTAADRRIYVLTPFTSLPQWEKVERETTSRLLAAGGSYENAPYSSPAYGRQQTIFVKAFDEMPALTAPKLDAPPASGYMSYAATKVPARGCFAPKYRCLTRAAKSGCSTAWASMVSSTARLFLAQICRT